MSNELTDEKLELIEQFERLLMDEFLKRCHYNDFGKLNLLTIGEVVEEVGNRIAKKGLGGAEMKHRLIELIKEGKRSFRGFCPNCDNDNCENCKNAGIADYLVTNGVIVPPCKVGDTVYSIFVGKVNPAIIGKLEISINCWDVDFSYEAIGELCPIQFCKENIGKTVFLTREEAERSIK